MPGPAAAHSLAPRDTCTSPLTPTRRGPTVPSCCCLPTSRGALLPYTPALLSPRAPMPPPAMGTVAGLRNALLGGGLLGKGMQGQPAWAHGRPVHLLGHEAGATAERDLQAG